MVREGALIGVIVILKSQVEPFTEPDRLSWYQPLFLRPGRDSHRECPVVRRGAINVLDDLRESLQQQTATGRCISSSSVVRHSIYKRFLILLPLQRFVCAEADIAVIHRGVGENFRGGRKVSVFPTSRSRRS